MSSPDASAAESPPRTARAGAWRGLVPFVPIALGTLLVARIAIRRTLEKVGHAAATLDDSYIHFQYARALAEGHPLRFQAGEPTTSGATSVLWPIVLAPFHAVGFRGDGIVWIAWAFGFAALGALAHEAHALTAKLAGKAAAAGAAAMVLAFAGFAWSAASGMEGMPFAWALARSARRASEWAEGDREGRRRAELVALAWIGALLRPEGAIAALGIAIVLARFPRGPGRERWIAGAALAAIGATPLFLWLTTGSAASTTASVKLLVGNPYYRGPALTQAIGANLRMLFGTILNGEVYSAEFLPSGGAPFAIVGLVSIAALGWRERRWWRAAFVIALALGMCAPCFYVTFLWNRLRYLWPFATGWLVGLACLARLTGDLAALVRPRWRIATSLVAGAFAGMLAMRLDWTLEDVAQSASGIDRQQATLGRWAKTNLPESARIGVNDTGAIAYFSDRRTFDIVGLTTRDEGKYWVAGAGSRLEHYERLYATAPARLPTHFIVYPEWMACDAVLGPSLHEATVIDATILGGQTMRVYEASYTRLGSGERPWSAMGPAIDTLDVADLESEAEHRYELGGARDGEQIAAMAEAPDGRTVVDGGRTRRTRERFVARLGGGGSVRGVMRIEATTAPTRVHVIAGDREVAAIDVPASGWTEESFVIPKELAQGETSLELRAEGGLVDVYHYWFERISSPE